MNRECVYYGTKCRGCHRINFHFAVFAEGQEVSIMSHDCLKCGQIEDFLFATEDVEEAKIYAETVKVVD